MSLRRINLFLKGIRESPREQLYPFIHAARIVMKNYFLTRGDLTRIDATLKTLKTGIRSHISNLALNREIAQIRMRFPFQ